MQEKINSNYLNAPKVNTLKTRETVKARKKEEPIDLDSFDDLREFLNLAKVMKEEIEVSEKTERIHTSEQSVDLEKNNPKGSTEEIQNRRDVIELLRRQPENKSEASGERKETEVKEASGIARAILNQPLLSEHIFSGEVKVSAKEGNIKLNLADKNINPEDGIVISVDVYNLPNLNNTAEKQKFERYLADTAEEQYLKTVKESVKKDKQNQDIFVNIKIPRKIITGLKDFMISAEKSKIDEYSSFLIMPLLRSFRKDIKFQISYGILSAIKHYFDDNKERELLEQYDKIKNDLTRIIEKPNGDKVNFLTVIKNYISTVSKNEKKAGKAVVLRSDRTIQNMLSALEHLTEE